MVIRRRKQLKRNMVLIETAVGFFGSDVSFKAKSPGTEKFEATFETSEVMEGMKPEDRYNLVLEYIKCNRINVMNRKEFNWL